MHAITTPFQAQFNKTEDQFKTYECQFKEAEDRIKTNEGEVKLYEKHFNKNEIDNKTVSVECTNWRTVKAFTIYPNEID